jgi:DNA-binding response OmpR family regulator
MSERRCRALIVEDDADASAALRNMLTLLGHEAVAVSTASAALTMLRANTYDAIILDLVLPDENGLVVLQHIRDQNSPTKVAVVTALYRAGHMAALEALQPDAVFKKPVDAVALAGWVAACAGRPPDSPAGP